MMCPMGLAGGVSIVRKEYPSEKEASLNHSFILNSQFNHKTRHPRKAELNKSDNLLPTHTNLRK